MFSNINNFCLFVGNSRSGTTLVGSLLNAHPNIVIGLKLDALQYIHKKSIKKKSILFSRLLEKSESFIRNKSLDNGYSYFVSNQYRDNIQVIGDAASGTSCIYLTKYPKLLDTLENMLSCTVKYLYMIRNPFDVIATTLVKTKNKKFTIYNSIEDILTQYKTMRWLKEKVGSNLYELKFECFIKDPKKELIKLCSFLDLPCSEKYLENCTIINPIPHKSRFEVTWPSETIDYIQKNINNFKFLEGYTWNL